MQRTRIRSVVFSAPESAPGSSVNGQATVLHVESDDLRLEFDEIGVISTALVDGKMSKIENNPVRYPWHVVRKVCGEGREDAKAETKTEPKSKAKDRRAAPVAP